jgi:hypothetical protein
MRVFSFFGQVDYLHEVVLPFTQQYVKNVPDLSGSFVLNTFDEYKPVFEALFPGFFQFNTVPLSSERCGYYSELEKQYPEVESLMRLFLHREVPNWLGAIAYGGDMKQFYLDSPIPCPALPDYDSLRQQFSKVVLLCLSTGSESDDAWKARVVDELQNPSTLCCIYENALEECIVPSFVDVGQANVRVVKTTDDLLYFSSKCDTAVVNDCVMNDFVKNCGAKHLVICPKESKVLFNAALHFNPFGTTVEIFGDYTLQL